PDALEQPDVAFTTELFGGDRVDEAVGDIHGAIETTLHVQDQLATFLEGDHGQRFCSGVGDGADEVGEAALGRVVTLANADRHARAFQIVRQALAEAFSVLVVAPDHGHVGVPVVDDQIAEGGRLELIGRSGPDVVRVVGGQV